MSVSLSIGSTPNYASVWVGPIRLEFSYRTVIAFSTGNGLIVRQNDWGPTTGKHLNALDGGSREAKARRIDSESFEAMLADVVARIQVVDAVTA